MGKESCFELASESHVGNAEFCLDERGDGAGELFVEYVLSLFLNILPIILLVGTAKPGI